MAFVHGSHSRIWIDGFPATGYLKEFATSTAIDTAETTTFNHTAKVYIAGLEDGTVKLAGFFDTENTTLLSTTTFQYLLEHRIRQVFPTLYVPNGDLAVAGDTALMINGLLTSFNVMSSTDAAVGLDLAIQATDGDQVGEVILSDAARTTSGASVSRDGGVANAPSVNGLNAILSVSAVSGTTPTLNVKFQDSADNSSFADVAGGAFTVNNSIDGQYLEVPGNVRRYVKVVYTIAGTTPSFTFNVAWRRK